MDASGKVVDGADRGTTDIAFVLLVLQGAMGLLSALGMLAFVRLAGGGPIALLPAFGVPAIVFGLAAGVSGYHRWARVAVIVFEGLVLLGAALRLLIGREVALNIVMLLSTIAIPLSVSALLLSRGARQAGIRGDSAEARPSEPRRPFDAAA